MDTEEIYKIAIALTPGVTAEVVRQMREVDMSFEDFFRLDRQSLMSRLEMSNLRIDTLKKQEALMRARREIEFIFKHSIKTLFLTDDAYPLLLRETYDAPVMLFVLGNTDLNGQPIFNMVGTRRCTSYGTGFCRKFIGDMAAYYPDATVVSGLAYGIDSAAHQAALDNNLRTVAVLAHGLDMIYPPANRDLARAIVSSGGALVSEYPSGTRPFQRNFLDRNRIVAGLSELTFVVESDIKGGAINTANTAFSYSREVMALPGRMSDQTSAGCNMLIARNKAHIFTGNADLIELMRWKIPTLPNIPVQRTLFPELEPDQAAIYEYLKKNPAPQSIDSIHMALSIAMPALMSSLTELEFEGLITKLPGLRYEIL